MTTTARGTKTLEVLGLKLQIDHALESNGNDIATPTPNLAVASTDWTKSGDKAGTAVVASAGGITTGSKVDVFWTGGKCANMEATVTGEAPTISIALTGAAAEGDNVPASDTQLYLCKQKAVSISFVGANLKQLFIEVSARSIVRFVDSGAEDPVVFEMVPPASVANGKGGYEWNDGLDSSGNDATDPPPTNPLAALTVASATISTSEVTTAPTCTIVAMYS